MVILQRYFINSKQIIKHLISITNSDVHHIRNVMRMKIGDKVIACDENENVYLTKIIAISKEEVLLEIIEKINYESELPVAVTIAHGFVRREKFEEVIRRLAELGCNEYQPVMMMRSIAKVVSDKSERHQKIIKEACEQAQRNRLMKINPVINFKQLIARKHEFSLCLYADLNDKCLSIKEALKNFNGQKILIVIGPEGGFSKEETLLLDEEGFIPITLGKRVLRTETAPLYVMSVLGHELESITQ